MNLTEFLIKVSSLSRSTLIILSVGVTFFYYSFLYDDGSSLKLAISNAEKEIALEREKEKESDYALKEVEIVKASLADLNQQFKLVSAQLPRDLQMAEVIRIVDNIAKLAELTIRTKEPKPTTKEQVIEVLPIQITADGTFSQLVKFLHYVTGIERIFRLQRLNIVSEDGGSAKNSSIKIRIDIASYRFLPGDILATKEGDR